MRGFADALIKLGPDLVRPLIVFAIVGAVGYLARTLVFRSLRAWAKRTTTDLDDIVIAAFSAPARLWVLMLALDIAVKSTDLPEKIIAPIDKALLFLWVLSLTLAASKLATSLFRHYGATLHGAAPVTTLGQNLIRLVIVSIGALLMLNTFGISITPILTALGVGGLAVALGMQETLANLFAGFFVSVAGHVRIGDYIKLNTGEEGYVTDISWRATILRALGNNVIVIPNSKLAQAMVTNYHMPDKLMAVQVAVNVAYDSDPDRVERVLLDEVMKAVGEVPGLAPNPAPVVRLNPGFGEFAMGFHVYCHVTEFSEQFLVLHELRKRIFKRLAGEGIRIPFPAHTLHVHGPAADIGRPAS